MYNIIAEDDRTIFKKKFNDYKDKIYSLIKLTQTYKNNLINEINNNLYDKIDDNKILQLNKYL